MAKPIHMIVRVIDEAKLTQDFFTEKSLEGACSRRPSTLPLR